MAPPTAQTFDQGLGVILLAGGKFLVAGYRAVSDAGGSGPARVLLERFNPDGTLDATFSPGGADGDGVLTFLPPGSTGATAIDVAAVPGGGGDFLIAGESGAPGDANFLLARFNADGSLERSFGRGGADGDGVVTTDFTRPGAASRSGDFAATLAFAGDGKILVGGSADGVGALARYKPDGSLDPTFGEGGRFDTEVGGLNDFLPHTVTDIAPMSDGEMAVAGTYAGVVKINNAGNVTATANFYEGRSIALDSGGGILAVASTPLLALGRFEIAGLAPEKSFGGGDGQTLTDFGSLATATALARTPDGKVIAVGTAAGYNSISFVARYNSSGSLDTSFGRGGSDGDGVSSFFDIADPAAVALLPGGKFLVAGRANTNRGFDFGVARFNADGTIDRTFGSFGVARVNVFSDDDAATGVAVLPDGDILVTGTGGNDDFAVARFNSNGTLDRSFRGDGTTTVNFGGVDRANALALLPDGRFVVAGSSGGDFAVARFRGDGSLDSSFSGDGKQKTSFGGDDAAYAVAVQPNGRIVLAGRGGANADFALARYTTGGSLDTSFSGDGKVTTDFGGSGRSPALADAARAVAVLPDGKILAAGTGKGDFAAARYSASGSLDSSFSGDGKTTTGFARGEPDGARALLVLPGNKYLFAGQAGEDIGLARYLGA